MLPKRYTSSIIHNHRLSETGYELALERKGLPFQAGQLVTIHGADITEDRSYTIAGGETDDHIYILYRFIPTGRLTSKLVQLQTGGTIDISGPFGEFVIRDTKRPMVFVATGTGIAPCRAYIRTHPGLDLMILHGVREETDLFYREEFSAYNYNPCISQRTGSEFPQRVTAHIEQSIFDPKAHFYLCGAYEMIFDVHRVLRKKGVDDDAIFSEEYYYQFNG